MKNTKVFRKQRDGFSLIELLVVIVIFTMISVIGTQIITATLRGTNKSEKSIDVRQNLGRVFDTMERQIRSAKSISCTGGSSTDTFEFVNQDNQTARFICNYGRIDNYYELASGTSVTNRISGEDIAVDCSIPMFICSNNPPSVEVTITATDASRLGVEGASITATDQIILRSN